MKKRYFFLITTLIGFSFLFILPFILYYLSKFFYFIGGLLDLYESFLLNYFEEFSVPFVALGSIIFSIAIIGAAFFVVIAESLVQRN